MMRAFMYATLIVLAPMVLGSGQTARSPVFTLPNTISSDETTEATPNPDEEQKLLNALNADRQKSMVSDTDKLLHLVNELNAEIVSKSPDALSPNQLRKIAEIEKLAHSVREKMSYSVRGTAPYHQPPPVFKR
jgi:hypothetical protein